MVSILNGSDENFEYKVGSLVIENGQQKKSIKPSTISCFFQGSIPFISKRKKSFGKKQYTFMGRDIVSKIVKGVLRAGKSMIQCDKEGLRKWTWSIRKL